MIIGIVYTLSIANFNKLVEKKLSLRLENLKEYLYAVKHEKSVKLLCLDDCSSCDILVDGEKTRSIESFLDENVKMYRYDTLYGYMQKEQEVYFNSQDVEEEVCFSYEIDRAGVGSQVLVEFKEKFYDYTPYFSKTKVYDSLGEAQEARQ